jgi:divalent metal cation (Fe/Co/Zn/Cd) transporter
MEHSQQLHIQTDNNLNTDSINSDRFHRLRRIAFWSCVISFIFDIALGLTAFVNCIRTKSFVGFSYSVHTFMDSLCTGFVSWHLMATTIHDCHRRDRLACCVIGALFIGSFLAIETRAIQSMMSPPVLRPDMTVVIYSFIHIIVFTVLSIIKIRISKQIRSVALKFDTLNSIIGIIMVFPLIVWDRVVFINKFTHLDDLVQVLMALFLFVAGGKLILDSITIMNTEYAKKLREDKLKKMLKESDDDDDGFKRANSNNVIHGT